MIFPPSNSHLFVIFPGDSSVCHRRPIFKHCQASDSTIIPDILNQGPANTQKIGVRSNSQEVVLARYGQGLETTLAGWVPVTCNNSGIII